METYDTSKAQTTVYDVFSANMTMDTNENGYSGVLRLACKSCQQCRSQCYGCRTGFAGERLEDSLSQLEIEKAFESILKVA